MNIFSAADRGGNSAWKGFSSQTIYISHRLLFERDKSNKFFPESIEDLKITDLNNTTIELIQVKNLSSDLSLSNLKPKKEGSFFKRALSVRKENESLVVRLISYGNIGSELLGWSCKKNIDIPDDNITSKLKSYGYSHLEIEWLRKNIVIEKKDESKLEEAILLELKENAETAVSPEIVFDILVNYISGLSRYQMSTSKVTWQQKVRTIALSLASVAGWKNQFGKTILPMSEYRDFNDNDVWAQQEAYENGVSALPQHILNDFDILRPYWMDILRKSYQQHNITILHGASGQGKSSLAYRYLIDNYATSEIFMVNGITNLQQAIDISAALRKLHKNEFNLIVYIDVRPYDKNWVWLVEQVFTLNLKIPVLVTIREEDFNRNPIDRNHIQYSDIELNLNESEAYDIYNRYPTNKHLSFEDSWQAFGDEKLLMEYIFFLRENESLKSRLQNQVNRLILEEKDVDSWLLILSIISYAGQKEVAINSKKIFSAIRITNSLKMLHVFNKEYWVQSSDNNTTLSSLHSVRASLLYEILSEKLGVEEKEILLQAIQFTDSYLQDLLIDYFYREPIDLQFSDMLSSIKFTTWSTYASVIESLLWLCVWQYYKKYTPFIDEGNSLTNNSFAFIMINDVTGYFNVDNTFLLNMFKEQNPAHFQKVENIIAQFEERAINYSYVDDFMKKTSTTLPLKDILTSDSLTYCGFALFWHAQRNIIIEENLFNDAIGKIDYSDILSVCELCLGIQMQNWGRHYETVLKNLKPLLTDQLNIVYLDDEHDILKAFVINDISADGSNHTKTMLAVDSLNLLYCEKDEYHITLIGSDIFEGIPVLDNTKTIKNNNLPYKWITRLNSWFTKIDEYKYLLNDWEEVFSDIVCKRQEVKDIANHLCKAIDEYFKRQKVNKFANREFVAREKQFKTGNFVIQKPKCDMNKFGLSTEISCFSDISVSMNSRKENSKEGKEYSSIIKLYNNYIQNMQNFLQQKDQLVFEKISRIDTSNNARLSYVNLMFSLELLPKMASYFNVFFNKYIMEGDFDKREEETMFLLGIMWEHMFNVPARTENSVMHTKKSEVKQQTEKVFDFINESIPHIVGVQEVIYTDDKELFILLDILHHEQFIEELYELFIHSFRNFEYATFDFALTASLIKKINVQYSYDSMPTLSGLQIAVMDFTKKTKEEFVETVMRKAIGFDNYRWEVSENRFKYILTVVGLIESFTIIQKHVEDVLGYLADLDSDKYVLVATTNNWKSKCDSITKELFLQISATCELLSYYLNTMEQKEALQTFLTETISMGNIDDLLINLIINKDKSDEDFSFSSYQESFTNIIDKLLAE